MADSEMAARAGPKASPSRPDNASVRRIKKIAALNQARSYLEIGVSTGATFNTLRFPRKVAVDPRFRFKVAEHEGEGISFHAITSDAYFTGHAGGETFDIIFLDGLHTLEQTLRDFCNSMSVAHARTVWLIDDVFPNDAFSALRAQDEAIAFRKEAGGTSVSWHGDTFKVVFFIRDFFPMLSFRTIIDGGNPQLLVWREPRAGFVPEIDSLERIERLDYFDLLRRKAALEPSSEQDAIDRLRQGLASSARLETG